MPCNICSSFLLIAPQVYDHQWAEKRDHQVIHRWFRDLRCLRPYHFTVYFASLPLSFAMSSARMFEKVNVKHQLQLPVLFYWYGNSHFRMRENDGCKCSYHRSLSDRKCFKSCRLHNGDNSESKQSDDERLREGVMGEEEGEGDLFW